MIRCIYTAEPKFPATDQHPDRRHKDHRRYPRRLRREVHHAAVMANHMNNPAESS